MSDTKEQFKTGAARERELRGTITILWDDSRIESEAELLPLTLRPLFIWLKRHVRDEFKRDVDILVERARAVGVTIDKTNWIRVLKGRWKHDAAGNELPNPYVSATNLFQAITAIQQQMRVELLQGGMPFVETTTFHTIRRTVEKAMKKDRVNRFRVIVGPTGTQKTASYKELALRNPHIKWLESSDNGSLKEFTIRLAVKCGAGRNVSYTAARSKVQESMMPHNGQVKCVIVDNMQDMIKNDRRGSQMGRSLERQPAYAFMRALQDETGCAVIWSITPEDEDSMFSAQNMYMEQFEGRAGGRGNFLRLSNFPPKADVVLIAKTLGLKDADKNSDELMQIAKSRGRIRFFFEIMQEAKDEAALDGKEFTMDYVDWAVQEATPPEAPSGAVTRGGAK